TASPLRVQSSLCFVTHHAGDCRKGVLPRRAPQTHASAKMCTQRRNGTHMRTNIEIDDKLMADALRATGAKTKKEAVELGLRTLLDLRAQEKARELRGKITWEGDLNAMRADK
ncbi:MAG TPA: type II toxin-antitoxin system VapB family antitoxin, partial [Aquabacterium sp.]|nr:type II toxin-antitoxin system VapB family antitoxin [Aquabacterium sp.]